MSSSPPLAARRMASNPQKTLEIVMRFGKRNSVLPSSSRRRRRGRKVGVFGRGWTMFIIERRGIIDATPMVLVSPGIGARARAFWPDRRTGRTIDEMRKSARALALWLTSMGLGLVVGCTHQDPADRSIEKLRADIAKIEAERDRLDQRVGVLEAAEQRRGEAPPTVARKATSEPVHQLPVVRVAADEAREGPLPAHG